MYGGYHSISPCCKRQAADKKKARNFKLLGSVGMGQKKKYSKAAKVIVFFNKNEVPQSLVFNE